MNTAETQTHSSHIMDNQIENKPIITYENFMMSIERQVSKTPKFDETFGHHPWVMYGPDNLYPQELIRLYTDASGLHAGIINKKADMIGAAGFEDPTDTRIKQFLKNQFSDETLDEVAYKCSYDAVMFGGYYLNIVWSRDGKIPARIDHIPFEKVRIKKSCEQDEFPIYYVSRDWSAIRKKDNKPIEYPAFSLTNKTEKSQILFVKKYKVGMDYYTTPSYTAILNWVKTASEISVFHLKAIQNGFMPGMIITHKTGIPTDEERDKIYQGIKNNMTGPEVANDVVLLFGNSPETVPDILPIQLNTSDERFLELINMTRDEIIMGHGVSSIVAGKETSGKLGARNEIEDAYEHFQITSIAPIQKMINDTFTKLMNISGIEGELKLATYKPFVNGQISQNNTTKNIIN